MKWVGEKDWFQIVLAVSVIGHVGLLSSHFFRLQEPRVNVQRAPNTVEMFIIEEIVQPKIEPIIEEIETQEVITIEESALEAPKIPEPLKIEIEKPEIEKTVDQKPDPIIEKEAVVLVESQESLGALVEAQPIELENPAPKYPRIARKRGWEGKVVLRVWVNKDGQATQVEVDQSSGYLLLDQAALKTVRKWKFEPARRIGMVFDSVIEVPVKFQLID